MSAPARTDVVVPTYRRRPQLVELLRSLVAVSRSVVGKVVVVDDSPEASVRPQEFPELDLRVVADERRRFISAARNRGLAELDGEFVLMIDDDNVVSAETFDHPLRVLQEDPAVWAVMPAVRYRTRPDLVWVYACPFAPGRWKFDLVGRNRPRDPALEHRLLPTDALPNAAFFRRDRLVEVGGYDPRLPVNSSSDLCRKLKDAGGVVVADTYAWTYHDVEPPGTAGFWAAHGVDAERTLWEKRDWFVLQRRLHPGAVAFPLRALAHALPFLGASALAYVLRTDAAAGPLLRAMGAGVVRGLRDSSLERLPGPPPEACAGPGSR